MKKIIEQENNLFFYDTFKNKLEHKIYRKITNLHIICNIL